MSWNKKNDILALMVGHGKQLNGIWDSGCVYGKYTEADLMLKIVKVAVKYLRKNGVRILTDADAKNNRNMKSCVAWANSKKNCKMYISVHCDYKLASAGVAPLFVSAKGKKMATSMGKFIAKYMGMKWKGAFKRTNLYELNATKMPAIILETGAIKADLVYLKRYRMYGRALAKAICQYIGVKYNTKTNAEKFNKEIKEVLTYMNNHHFKYVANYGECGKTWDEAKRKRVSNCQMAVCYALQESGILPKSQSFWINGDNIVCKGGLTLDALKKIANISHPHKKPSSCSLKVGDITGYGKPYSAHTMEYAGKTDKGVAKWCSWSNSDIGKAVPHVKKTYSDRPISTVVRLK